MIIAITGLICCAHWRGGAWLWIHRCQRPVLERLALGVTHALVKNSTALVRWLVELSCPVYLLHLLPAMVISAMLIGAGFGQLPVVAMTIILTFIISVIGYYVLIKFTPNSWVVNGCLKSWLQLAFLRGR